MDSASGSHCTDFTNFGRTADLKSSSLPKFVKNSTSNTAIPRILEEEKQVSLRDTAPVVSWQSNSAQAESNQINGARKACNLERTLSQTSLESSHTAQKVESSFKKADSMDCRDLPSKSRNDRKPSPRTLESKRHKLHTSTYSLHTFLESQAPLKSPTNLESTFDKTQMDCHATAYALARNDKNNTQSLSASQAAAKSSKTQTRILVQNDSKICGGAVVALRLLGKVSDLGDRAFHKRRNTAALLAQS